MKWIRPLLPLLLCAGTFAAARPASAQETQVAVGAAVTALSTQVQGDLELDRQFGFQAGIGAPLYGWFSSSAGGRFYFTQRNFTPYVGALVSFQNEQRDYWYNHHYYRQGATATLIGPTLGLRFRQSQEPGLGLFVQAEFLQETRSPGYVYPSLGAGLQWWF